MILRLTDGTTTINLTGGSAIRLAGPYMPLAPKGEGDVSESVEVTITGTDTAAVEAQVRALESLLCQAREYQRSKVADRVWVEFRWGGSGTVYRSELKDGRIEPDRKTGTAAHRADAAIQALVAWQRVPYWEGAQETLKLANDYAYVVGTSGLGVYNHNDPAETVVDDEVIDVGDGTKNYGGTFAHIPVKRSSVTISYTIGSVVHTATDDGYGVLTGEHATGTIVYATGVWTLTIDVEGAIRSITDEVIVAGNGVDNVWIWVPSMVTYTPVVSLSETLKWVYGAASLQLAPSHNDPVLGDVWDGDTGGVYVSGNIILATGLGTIGFWLDAGYTVPAPPDNGTDVTMDYQYIYPGPDFGVDITADYTYKSAGHVNYVDVLANDIDGVLPVPAIVEVQNSGAGAYNFFIGHNVFEAPASLNHILEAVGTGDGDCSGATYHAISLTGSEAKLDAWYLYPADNWAGGWFQVVARFRTAPPAGTRVRLRAGYGSTGTPLIIANAPWKELGTDLIQELGAIRLPPWKASAYSTPAVVLALYGYNTAGSGTLELDFLQTTPTDSYRAYRPGQTGVYIDNLHLLIDDGVEEEVYHLSAGGIPYGDYVPYGDKIVLWPGRVNRLYFLLTEESTAPIDHQATVWVRYRQRRATL